MPHIELSIGDTYKGDLILVTPNLSLQHFPTIKEMSPAIIQQEILLDKQVAKSLQELLGKIQCRNEIIAVSGFRTQKEQEKIWNDSLKENGLAFTEKFVAIPKHSEHQTGLAIDLAENKGKIDFIRPSFPDYGIFKKFRENAPYYGFIERYQAGQEIITGIGAEPWHFRYVGYPHSVVIDTNKITLEEYIKFIKNETDFKHPYVFHGDNVDVEISYIYIENMTKTELSIPDGYPYLVSGTNEGGIILSIWRI